MLGQRVRGEVSTIRVLIVDDDPDRHTAIGCVLADLDRVGTEVECMSRYGPDTVKDEDLAGAQFMFLDHDMCQQGLMKQGRLFLPDPSLPCPNPTENGTNMLNSRCGCPTGMDLVKRIVALPHRPAVIVHTRNYKTGPKMADALLKAGFHHMELPADELASPVARLRLLTFIRKLHELLSQQT